MLQVRDGHRRRRSIELQDIRVEAKGRIALDIVVDNETMIPYRQFVVVMPGLPEEQFGADSF